MCYGFINNKKPISKEEIELGIRSEIELAMKLDQEAMDAFRSKDMERAMTACALIDREGGITWRLREIIEQLLKNK